MRSNKFLLVFLSIFLTFFASDCSFQNFLLKKNIQSNQNRVGCLVFLPWDDDWNQFMYPKEKAVQAMNMIEKSGIKWVRMDFSRTKIEPTKNQYNYKQFDWLVEELHKRDISILGVLGYSPPWASQNGQWNSPPTDLRGFGKYIFETVGRYKGKVDYWEIWNEPNHNDYWQPQGDLSVYVQLLKEAYLAAKSANPKSVVLNGALAEANAEDLRKLYQLGAKDYFDIVNVHLIDITMRSQDLKRDITNKIVKIKNMIKQFHDEKKRIWITEIGYPGIPQLNESDLNSEQKQANVLLEVMATAINNDVDLIFWAFFQDTKKFFNKNGIDYFGLVRSDFTQKPSFDKLEQWMNR